MKIKGIMKWNGYEIPFVANTFPMSEESSAKLTTMIMERSIEAGDKDVCIKINDVWVIIHTVIFTD